MKESFLFIYSNPITRLITAAGMFRHFSDAIISSFAPAFFMKTYPLFKAEFAFTQVISLTFLGLASNLIAGIIGDKLERKYPMTKGYLTTLSTLISIPLIFLCCLGHGNFWISSIALSMHILFSGGYHSTAITMVENSVSVGKTSNIVSAW